MTDLHTHTTFSDGKNTPEEMVQAAIEKGMGCIGFSDHCYTSFDESYCLPKHRLKEYRDTIYALKEKYRGKIKILCGIEQDLYSDTPTDDYEYVIGSLHYLKVGDEYFGLDYRPHLLKEAVQKHFGGDFYSFAETYYSTLTELAENVDMDIIGHIDLVTKFNEGGALFDETHPRYVAAWRQAVDRLLKKGIPFEINTGALARGWRTTPYPSAQILEYIRAHGGKLILSSDSHSAQTLCNQFEAYADKITEGI